MPRKAAAEPTCAFAWTVLFRLKKKAGRRQKSAAEGKCTPRRRRFTACGRGAWRDRVMDAALIPSPESLERFSKRKGCEVFPLAVMERLARIRVAREREKERERPFHLFEAYDIEGDGGRREKNRFRTSSCRKNMEFRDPGSDQRDLAGRAPWNFAESRWRQALRENLRQRGRI